MRTAFLLITFVLLVGCKPGAAPTPEKGDDEAERKRIAALQKGGGKPADNAEKIAAIEKEASEMKPVEPVHFEKLQPLLPQAPAGYKAERPNAETIKAGEFSHTYVECQYRKDDNFLTVKIHDTAMIPQLYKAFAVASQMSAETNEGHAKGVTVDGDPGWEEFKKASKRTTLTVLVGKRFLVEVRADGVPVEFAHTVLKSIDRKKLLALK